MERINANVGGGGAWGGAGGIFDRRSCNAAALNPIRPRDQRASLSLYVCNLVGHNMDQLCHAAGLTAHASRINTRGQRHPSH